MRKLNPLFLFIFLIALNANAQLDAIHHMEMNSSCDKVYIHSGTGIPIFKTQTSYVAIHPSTYEKLWEVKRQGSATITEVASEDNFLDYFEYPASTLVYVGNSFVDVISGKVLVDGTKDEIKRIGAFHLFPAKDLLTVKVIAKGVYRLYAFNPIKNTLVWKTDIDELGALSMAGLSNNDPVAETSSGLKPYISSYGDIIYVHQKNMMLIDVETGKLKWSKPLEPGAILFSKSGKLIAIAERRTGLGEIMGAFSDPKFSKRLVVVDAATGEDAWKKEIKLDGNILFIQPYKDGFIAAHEEGFNIYDFNSTKAEPEWKKDFSAKDISDIVEDGDKIMVYYKDRRILMDPVTGDEVWKKPERLEKEVPVFTGGNTFRVGDVDVTHSGSYLRLNNPKTKKYESFPSHRYSVDKDNNIIVSTYTEFNSVGGRHILMYHADLNTMKLTSTDISQNHELQSISIVRDGFFVNGPQSFILMKLEGDKLKTVKSEFFSEPGAFGRGLLDLAVSAAAVNYVVGAGGAGVSYLVGDQAAMNGYENRMRNSVIAGEMASAIQTRATAPKIDKDFAFFFSKDDKGNLALYQIKKEDGSETARYKFDDKTPVYEIDYANGQLYYMNGKSMKIFKLKVG